MKRYVILRVLLLFVNLALVSTFLFYALTFADFAEYYELPFMDYIQVSTRLYKVFVEERILRGAWGYTIDGLPVIEYVIPSLWVTLKYNIIAFCIYFHLGLIIGFFSAYWNKSFIVNILNAVGSVLASVPIFILIMFLILVVGYQLQWFPTLHNQIPDTVWGRISGLGIPMIALCSDATMRIARITRQEMLANMSAEYFDIARTKGMTKIQVMRRHMLKNAMVPILPVLTNVFLIVLTGSFFVEIAYQIPGAGIYLYDALIKISPIGTNYIRIDINVVMVIAMFYSGFALIFFFVIDLLHYVIDPRIRF